MIKTRAYLVAFALFGCASGGAMNRSAQWTFVDETSYYSSRRIENPLVAAQLRSHLGYLGAINGFTELAQVFSSETANAEMWAIVLDVAPESGVMSAAAITHNVGKNAIAVVGTYDDVERRFKYSQRELGVNDSAIFFDILESAVANEARDCIGKISLDARIVYVTARRDNLVRRFSYFSPYDAGIECDFLKDFIASAASVAGMEAP